MKFLSCAAIACALLLGACGDNTSPASTQPVSHSEASSSVTSTDTSALKVMAYYTGDGSDLGRYNFAELTHVIFSFLHLNANQLSFDSETDKQALKRLVALKAEHPQLKVIISMGGWGGCETCSDTFASEANRSAYAQSVLRILQDYHADGLDLDWEYPSIEGFPGHKFSPADKANFTALVQTLRQTLGEKYELSFAAGGFDEYLQNAVDWKAIMPLLNSVNLMSYDIVNGNTPHTGHHTSLYSTPEQKDSTDNGVRYLLQQGVAPEKIVIGAAFYSRTWTQVENLNHGLYQPGTHVEGLAYKDYASTYTQANGYQYYWDDVAKAPYVYNAEKKIFATFDDKHSVTEKIHYIKTQHLGGIMFWQLPQDTDHDGLLDTIYQEKISPAAQGH